MTEGIMGRTEPKEERVARLKIEPGSVLEDFYENSGPTEREIAHSVAISLKRLADAVCGDEKNGGIFRAVHDIANNSYRGPL